ncbi:metallopeptidase family protein [Xanthobacter sp. VTT E-85241]|jgi:predicted Zn-dependent protease with MMP-like domain|uniref:metallopeptidase family protein n=1 Tax=Roseixanthobacter finlandensis TaxID=3119922 RepID=UPI002C62F726|nr:metallopeptidase family protein [Xanthobacteraceae bacterium]
MPNGSTARTNAIAWRTREAPSLEAFEILAEDAFARLPESFRALCGGVVLRVEDFPEDDVLEELEAESPFDLLGLFQGVGLAQAGAISETGRLPNMVFLYRRPILDYWSENEETLGEIIAHVLIHEIGHHFGLSDDDMERVESQVED